MIIFSFYSCPLHAFSVFKLFKAFDPHNSSVRQEEARIIFVILQRSSR